MSVLRNLVDGLFTRVGQLKPAGDLPLTKAKWILSDHALDDGGDNTVDDLIGDLRDKTAFPFTQQTLIDILGDIEDVVDYQHYTGNWSARAYTAGQVAKASDGEYYEAKRDLADTVAEPTADNADWKLLETLEKATAVFHEYLTSHDGETGIRSEILQLVEVERYKGAYSHATYAVGDEILSTDSHYYVRLFAGTESGSDTAPTASDANWRKVANGSLEQEIIAFHRYLIERGKIFQEDWGSLPLNTLFRVGDMIKRYTQWFVCEVQHRKGAVGPDNDPVNWSPMTNFAGDYDEDAWYHAGIYVNYRGYLAFSLRDIVPSDPAPDHYDNEGWLYAPNDQGFQPWQYDEPAGGVDDLEIDSQDANNGAVENITDTLDADQRLVRSIRAAQDAGLKTELRISATLKYFWKQDAPLSNSSGAILSVDTWLGVSSRTVGGVSTHAAPARFLVKLDDNDLTLADFRNSNGGRAVYGDAADITKQISFVFDPDDFHAWHLRQGEALDFILLGNNVNGFASAKLEIDDVAVTFDLSTASHYEAVKAIVQDGDRIEWTPDDDANTITPVIDFPPDPEPLRYRAVVSNDVRVSTEKYQIEYGGTSYTVQHSASRVNTFTPAHPNLPDDYDATKVNLVYDGGDHQFNPSGIDFTAESAGSTTRTIRCTLEIAPDPSQERSNNDVLNLVILGFNRARINGQASINKRLAFANSQTYPFIVHFNLTYTGAPRSGIQDSLVFTLQSDISRIKVLPKLTYFLPFTGAALPTQTYDQPGTNGHVLLSSLSAQEHDQIVPAELARELRGYGTSRIALLEIPSGSANREGRNDPTEEDHSDSMRAALGSHGSVFLEATQDLSQLHLTLHQKAEVVSPRSYPIYLCTYLRGVLKPEVVAHGTLHSVAPPWTIDWIGKGILKGQRFFILAQDVIGDAAIVWDASLQDTVRTVTVKRGFTTSREIMLGSAADTFTLGNIVNLPPVETWVKLRFFSSGLVSTVDWPENYIEGFPTDAGQPSLTHNAIGPISVHNQQSSGSIVHNRYVVPWQDSPDWKVSIYADASLDSVYLDKIELEYELLI